MGRQSFGQGFIRPIPDKAVLTPIFKYAANALKLFMGNEPTIYTPISAAMGLGAYQGSYSFNLDPVNTVLRRVTFSCYGQVGAYSYVSFGQVDLTGFTKLKFIISCDGQYADPTKLGISDTLTGALVGTPTTVGPVASTVVKEMDISAYSGLYFIRADATVGGGSGTYNTSSNSILACWLE